MTTTRIVPGGHGVGGRRGRRGGGAALLSVGLAALTTGPVVPPQPLTVAAQGGLAAGPVLATVRVGVHPIDLAVDGRLGRVFVLNGGDAGGGGSVSVLDAATGRVRGTTPLGVVGAFDGFNLGQQALGVDSHTGRVFVLRAGKRPETDAGSVAVLDAASGRPRGAVGVGVHPLGLAVDERTGRVFVANGGGGVSVLDSATGRLLRTVPGLNGDGALAVDGRAGRVVVAAGNAVGVLDAGTGALLRVAPLPARACAIAVDSRAGLAVVAGSTLDSTTMQAGSAASLLDTRAGRVRRTLFLDYSMLEPQACSLEGNMPAVGIDGARGRAVVVDCPDATFDGLGPCLVNLLDTRQGRMLVHNHARIGTELAATSQLEGAGAVTVDARRGLAFVATFGVPSTVVALDTGTGRVRAQIGVGRSAAALAVDEQRDRLFVANEADGTVSVIDTTHL